MGVVLTLIMECDAMSYSASRSTESVARSALGEAKDYLSMAKSKSLDKNYERSVMCGYLSVTSAVRALILVRTGKNLRSNEVVGEGIDAIADLVPPNVFDGIRDVFILRIGKFDCISARTVVGKTTFVFEEIETLVEDLLRALVKG
jgi:hypothetical protein